MRLWSLHPKYLDTKGLVALWREGLLAQNVLLGNTKGYKNHPQLERFKEHDVPLQAISAYLFYVHQESVCRNYKFNIGKIQRLETETKSIHVTDGQLLFELRHLKGKLKERSPESLKEIESIAMPDANPLFVVIEGAIANWERT